MEKSFANLAVNHGIRKGEAKDFIFNKMKDEDIKKMVGKLTETSLKGSEKESSFRQPPNNLTKKEKRRWKGQNEKIFMDMLRTTIRNHYTMNQMMDRKARNMISVNAILLSVMIGSLIGQFDFNTMHYFGLITFSLFSFTSIVLAILAMSPEDSHGELTGEDIINKQGNPLFFGNFKNLSSVEYENAMIEMMPDREFVFRAMIQDIFFLGQELEKKRFRLKTSLFLFIIGFALTLVLTFSINLIAT